VKYCDGGSNILFVRGSKALYSMSVVYSRKQIKDMNNKELRLDKIR